MQVLKFGGSSVGSVEAIHQMVSIVSTSLQKEKTVVVISAMSGVTDLLLLLAQSAAQGSASYTSIIDSIEKKHIEVVKALIPSDEQAATLELVKQLIKELSTASASMFQLKELSLQLQDTIISYGELRSEEHTSELQSRVDISYAVFCLKKNILKL